MRNKVGILIESDFYEPEIDYYSKAFKDAGLEVHFLTRLWGNAELTFTGHENRRFFKCRESFEGANLKEYAAVIIPAGYVADRLRYTEDIKKLPPACQFLQKCFADKKLIKGIICHGSWLMAPIAELVKGRKMVVHNNLLGDAKLMGIDYVDEDVVVDGDLVSARTGGDHVAFAQKIIALIQCGEIINSLNEKIDTLEKRIKRLEHFQNTNRGGNKMAKVLIAATEYGSWGEELQAPWDIIKKAGHSVTLATRTGKKPYPLQISVDPNFFDPVQKVYTNPKEVCDRIKELVDGDELNNPLKFKDCDMKDYDAIVLTGGLGAMFDMCNDYYLHKLIMDAYKAKKVVAALCYATSALIFLRDPDNGYKSIVYGHKMTAHPRAWDFYGDYDSSYELYGTDWKPNVITPGFLWPVEDLTIDAVGPDGECVAIPTTSRENPTVVYDGTFITGTSVESSIAYGEKVVEVLKERGF